MKEEGAQEARTLSQGIIIVRVNAPYWISRKANSEISSKNADFEGSGVKRKEFQQHPSR